MFLAKRAARRRGDFDEQLLGQGQLPFATIGGSRRSQAEAMAQSPLTIRGEMPTASAVSSIVKPAK
jgi:hypothetical protein